MRYGLPPASRLKLNERLFSIDRLPSRVEKIVRIDKAKPTQLVSVHEYSWTLAPTDHQRVQEIDGFLAQYRRVDLEAFFHP